RVTGIKAHTGRLVAVVRDLPNRRDQVVRGRIPGDLPVSGLVQIRRDRRRLLTGNGVNPVDTDEVNRASSRLTERIYEVVHDKQTVVSVQPLHFIRHADGGLELDRGSSDALPTCSVRTLLRPLSNNLRARLTRHAHSLHVPIKGRTLRGQGRQDRLVLHPVSDTAKFSSRNSERGTS